MPPKRSVEGTNLVHLRRSNEKGRYLVASREIRIGTILFAEEAFAGILVKSSGNGKHCFHCFTDIIEKPVGCLGCGYALYCSIDCKIAAWKNHHWIECFMKDILNEVNPNVLLSLRTLLNAAQSFCGENTTDSSSLLKIMKNIFSQSTETSNFKSPYSSNYWSIYCLQSHRNESAIQKDFPALQKDIKMVADILMNCFSIHGKISKKETDFDFSSGRKRKSWNSVESLFQMLFKKLAFLSYHTSDHFDIEMWKLHVQVCCLRVRTSESPTSAAKKSIADVSSGEIVSEQDLLERLLFHHALQVRTNAQAIFKLCESAGPSRVQIVEQTRIATCFFSITSLMNHSCSPNVTMAFDGRNIKVIASNRIMKGEEICHCYGPHYGSQGVDERQQQLREQYFFTCQCSACEAELGDEEQASFRLQFYAFKCRYCMEPLKPDNVNEFQDGIATGTCINEECKKQLDLRWNIIGYNKVKAAHVEAATLMNDGLIKQAVVKFKSCLSKAEDVLYHNHTSIAKLNDKIAQCYVILEDYCAAIPHLGKSIAIIGMLYGPQSIEVAHEFQKLASLYFTLRYEGQSEKIARKVLSIYKTHYRQENLFPPGADEMAKIVEVCSKLK